MHQLLCEKDVGMGLANMRPLLSCIIPALFAYFLAAIPTSFYIFNVFYFLVSIRLLALISVTARPKSKKSIISFKCMSNYNPRT